MSIKPDKDRALRHIADHTLWYSSGGVSGYRGDICNCDLSELTDDDMAGMTLEGAFYNDDTIFPKTTK